MTTDYRALCAELLADYEQHLYRFELIARVRAALAAEPVAEVPTYDDLSELCSEHGLDVDSWPLEKFEALWEVARAVLARWGRPAPVPAEGEVAWLIEFLRNFGDELMNEHGGVAEHNLLTRAADLLEQRHPAPPAAEEVGYAKDVRRMCDIILGNTFGNEELDSLALLVGHHADVLNAAPPAEGEVADEARYLAKELRDQADDLSPSLELFGLIHRAADLLEQRQPAPQGEVE